MGKTYKTRPIRLSELGHKPNHNTQAGNTSEKKRAATPSRYITTNRTEVVIPFLDDNIAARGRQEASRHRDERVDDDDNNKTSSAIAVADEEDTRRQTKCPRDKRERAAAQRRQLRVDIGIAAQEAVSARAYGRMNRFERAMNEVMAATALRK